jgi:hypothetical protein
MRIGNYFKVYSRVYSNPDFDYLDVYLTTPCLFVGESHDLLGKRDEWTASVPTELQFIRSGVSWYFSVRLLGFGFALKRQWDY